MATIRTGSKKSEAKTQAGIIWTANYKYKQRQQDYTKRNALVCVCVCARERSFLYLNIWVVAYSHAVIERPKHTADYMGCVCVCVYVVRLWAIHTHSHKGPTSHHNASQRNLPQTSKSVEKCC